LRDRNRSFRIGLQAEKRIRGEREARADGRLRANDGDLKNVIGFGQLFQPSGLANAVTIAASTLP
jgi:hypothetical protein